MGVIANRAVLAFLAVAVPFVPARASAQSPQAYVRPTSHDVMPFDGSKTLNVFNMNESGGIQRVVAKDPKDSQQIALIQRRLSWEAWRFQQGDYSGPQARQGEDMPALDEMRVNARKIRVFYRERTDGGEIVFETSDPHALTGIHRWLGAQLSEHGVDARAE